MRVVFIGCVDFSFQMLSHLLTLPEFELVGVVTRRQSDFNADFKSIEPLAESAGSPCFIAKGNDQNEMADWIKELNPDVVYCFGWAYLLSKEILKIAPLGVVGYHPALLPKNRGRHPIIWALALGLTETASTFFFMDEGADSGDILSQVKVKITSSDAAGSLYKNLSDVARKQVSQFTAQLAGGNSPRIKQNHSQANYWRKRGKNDGLIDWRMSAGNIHNLVRALTHPYVGAHCLYLGGDRKVWKCEWLPLKGKFANIEPGKVLKVRNKRITIKCGEDAVVLIQHELDPLPKEGDYL